MTLLTLCPLPGVFSSALMASDVRFVGRRLSICLIWAGVFPRTSYQRRSRSAIAALFSSANFSRILARRIALWSVITNSKPV